MQAVVSLSSADYKSECSMEVDPKLIKCKYIKKLALSNKINAIALKLQLADHCIMHVLFKPNNLHSVQFFDRDRNFNQYANLVNFNTSINTIYHML